MKENDYEFETLSLPPYHPCGKYRDLGQCDHHADNRGMTKAAQKPSLWKRLCGFFKLDWVFGFLFLVSIALLILENLSPETPIAVDPKLKILILAGLTLFVAAFATFAAALDKRHADDYYFQLMTNGAIIGIITTLFVNTIWDMVYGPLRGDDLIAVMLASWSLGYFFYRIRGLNQ